MAKYSWSNKYPSQSVLRKDIDALIYAFMNVLFQNVPKKDVDTIYFKGSASKKWESVIDYVPNVSDVDLHVRLRSYSSYNKLLCIENSLKFVKSVEKEFFKLNPKHYHMPRLEMNIYSFVKDKLDYLPTPKTSVKIIYGTTPYDYILPDRKKLLKRAREQIFGTEKFLNKLPMRTMDKDSSSLLGYIKDMCRQITNVVPNTLTILGLSYDDSWKDNRTTIYNHLLRLGKKALAKNFADFYYYAWQYELTYDADNCRKSITSGYYVFEECMAIAKKKK